MIPYVFEAVRGKPYMNFLRTAETIKVNLCKRDLSREIPRIPFPQFPNKSIACMWRMSSPYALSLLKHTEKVRWFCIKGRLRPIIRQTFVDSLSGLWASNTHSFSISLEVKTSLVLFCFVKVERSPELSVWQMVEKPPIDCSPIYSTATFLNNNRTSNNGK